MGINRFFAQQRKEVAWGLRGPPGRCGSTCSLSQARRRCSVPQVTVNAADPDRVETTCECVPRMVRFWKRFLMEEILLGDVSH